MTEGKKKCPFKSGDCWVDCIEDQCIAWRDKELYRDRTGVVTVKGCKLIP